MYLLPISSNKHFSVFCVFIYSLPIMLQIVSLQIVHISKCNFNSIIVDVQPQITSSLYFSINKWSKNNQSNSISNITSSMSPLHLHRCKHTHCLCQWLLLFFLLEANKKALYKNYPHCHSIPSDAYHQISW